MDFTPGNDEVGDAAMTVPIRKHANRSPRWAWLVCRTLTHNELRQSGVLPCHDATSRICMGVLVIAEVHEHS